MCCSYPNDSRAEFFLGQKYAPGHCGSGVVPAQIQSGGKVLLLLWGSSQRAEFGTWDLIIIFDLCSGPPLVQSDLQSMWLLSKRYFWNMRILWGISNVGLLLNASHWQMNIPEDNLSILQGLCPKSKPAIASAERGYHGKVSDNYASMKLPLSMGILEQLLGIWNLSSLMDWRLKTF